MELSKSQAPEPCPGDLNSVGLRWSLRGAADVASPRTIL